MSRTCLLTAVLLGSVDARAAEPSAAPGPNATRLSLRPVAGDEIQEKASSRVPRLGECD